MRLVFGSLGIALAALLVQAAGANANDGCGCGCEKCGCDNCDISCRLVCEVKKVPKVTYCCKCEPFCVAHPCPFNQVHEGEQPSCECECNSCNHECAAELWLKDLFRCDNAHASSADSLHKKQLVKFVNQKEVRVYKWVAEKTCPRCGCCSECACGGAAPSPAPSTAPGMPGDVPAAPAPMPGKSAQAYPATNMPAGYPTSLEQPRQHDPMFQSFYNK